MAEPATLINPGIIIDDPATQLAIVKGKLADLETAIRYADSRTEVYDQYLELKLAFEQYRRLEGK